LAKQVEVLMLKEIVLIHPLGQVVALLFGTFNLVTGWTRKCFILPLHINLGVMFYVVTFIGAVMGMLIARMAANDGMNLASPFHSLIALFLLCILICAMLSGFYLLRKKGSRTWLHAMHRYCNLAVVVLFICQSFSGLLILITVL
jgi:hypothetical protein